MQLKNKYLTLAVKIFAEILQGAPKMKFRCKILFLTALLAALLCSSCTSVKTTDHIPPVSNFNLQRYLGVWYEIARLPHSFERNASDVHAEYILLPNQKVRVINRGKRNGQTIAAVGTATFDGDKNTGLLAVSFFRPFYGTYKIIYLDKDYTLAIVTGDTMDYAWILAREPHISPEKLSMCLRKLDDWGYEVKLLQYPSGTNISESVIPKSP